ncbi:nuclear transport factor 2 family protein [Sphingobium sp. 15-1]|uniref:nuclear transport factor 2 family protein n=1 Tax=Sphingobium sp. 15-1 TaxID=2729616 RepID=UPI00159C36E5
MNDELKQQIRDAEDARFAAVIGADIPALESLLHKELLYRHSSGFADTRETYIEGLRAGLWVYRAVDRSEETISVSGHTGLVFNRLCIDLLFRGERKHVNARALSVWVRDDGQWRLIAVQSGAVPREDV